MGALDLRPVNNETYQFAKAFSEGDFCACGQMLIPGGAEKPTKNTRANAMVGCAGTSALSHIHSSLLADVCCAARSNQSHGQHYDI